ncbi:4Fe-4S ferredoxin [Brachyspira hyodysenteriae]|uniref:ATP-binding protein n=1 Tax=Brachyspira hyodysenteriae TaxID=159 RepID=UPI00063DD055|nr:4Fe-4S binding protein [Brachyspira hyodysenteriae]KLI27951.1 4Fe-4S ferredoxin [Brachyspira hyodysenteriae]TVL72836.1 4Fe-4S ferredoxin [Brachyspira hyodysenteriae]TVL88849.1 4Fe-4S ferredoxin [Brachyspira hyodysenteriae]
MKRRIIKIDEDKCTGCGICIPDCPEGALQVIDGKARLISDLFCDGLGACIKACPENAMEIEEREAEEYDESKVMENIIKGGANVIKAHLEHLRDHGEDKLFNEAVKYLKDHNMEVPNMEENKQCGCPVSMQKDMRNQFRGENNNNNIQMNSELRNWPIQLKLMNPNANYLDNADLLIAADCVPFSYPNFHSRFLKNKTLLMFCPKLDTDIDSYIEKLVNIFTNKNIKSISIVRMEVPCCGGVEMIVQKALEIANKNIIIKEYIISIDGHII